MVDGRWPICGRLEAVGDVRRNLRGSQTAIWLPGDARGSPGAGGDALSGASDFAGICDGSPCHFRNPHAHVEFLFELQRAMELTRRRHARPPDLRILRVNTQARIAPQGVFGVFEVPKETRKVHESRGIGFGKYDSSSRTKL